MYGSWTGEARQAGESPAGGGLLEGDLHRPEHCSVNRIISANVESRVL